MAWSFRTIGYDYENLGVQIYDTVEIYNPFNGHKNKGFFLSFSLAHCPDNLLSCKTIFKDVNLIVKSYNKIKIMQFIPTMIHGKQYDTYVERITAYYRVSSTRMVLTEKVKFISTNIMQ